MSRPIKKQPVTLTTMVPTGNRAPNLAVIAVPARYRASEPTPPPASISRNFIAPPRSFRLQALRDVLLRDRPGLDHFPVRLSDVDRGRPGVGAYPAVQHQVHTPVHHPEHFDPAAARRMP